jgi:hypothetical protein
VGCPAAARAVLERTRAFLAEHGAFRIDVIGGGGRIILKRAGSREGAIIYVPTDAWHPDIHPGSDPRRAARALLAAGFLLPGEEGRLTTRLPREVPGRPRAYAVTADILGAGDD